MSSNFEYNQDVKDYMDDVARLLQLPVHHPQECPIAEALMRIWMGKVLEDNRYDKPLEHEDALIATTIDIHVLLHLAVQVGVAVTVVSSPLLAAELGIEFTFADEDDDDPDIPDVWKDFFNESDDE